MPSGTQGALLDGCRLVNELQQAQDEHRLSRFSTAALKLDLLVLDQLGFIPFSPAAAQLLFTFYSELHERVAVIVTSNLKFADWIQIFGQERLTAALLDRLTQKAHILELIGESYRFRQRLQRDACNQPTRRADDKWITAGGMAVTHLPTAPTTTTATASDPSASRVPRMHAGRTTTRWAG